MENQHCVGIDISKKTLDWAMFDGQGIVFCASTENSATGIRSALSQMGEIPGYITQKTIFCIEHTARRTVGIYNAHIMEVMYRFGLPIWLENSTQIKQATGCPVARDATGQDGAPRGATRSTPAGSLSARFASATGLACGSRRVRSSSSFPF